MINENDKEKIEILITQAVEGMRQFYRQSLKINLLPEPLRQNTVDELTRRLGVVQKSERSKQPLGVLKPDDFKNA